MAASTIEAKFVADRLTEEGILAIPDRQDINMLMGGFQPQMWGYGMAPGSLCGPRTCRGRRRG
jgi:hypothetical protein